ncbi:MAG: homocysteine S-methyltransferase family protein [Pirellulaceae bacterium]|nr:homocysteine S-methyltransferase family protein [Pirellulaceae bacterium]
MHWQRQLATNEIILIDGGTGTELQRRGVPMNEIAWSGAAVLSHPEAVRDTHLAYIAAGAEVVIANTFGSTRQMLEPAGYGERVQEVNQKAIKLAIAARQAADRPIAVAGSLSAMPPSFKRDQYLSPAEELACYEEAIHAQTEAGADLIALEMMDDTHHAKLAMQAALKSDLPIWLGISCKLNDGRLVSFGDTNLPLDEVLDCLIPLGPDVVNIMHSDVDTITPAIKMVRERWEGPIGVYPESGYFTRPDWNFVDIIPPAELAGRANAWVADGVRLLGGCCGTGPDHIQALRQAMPELNAAR